MEFDKKGILGRASEAQKSAAVMAERAEMTKAAQSKAATALFTQILHVI